MANSYLVRTPGSAGNTKKFTISAWVKRSLLGSTYSTIFSSWSADSIAGHFALRFDGSDRLDLSTWSVNVLTTNRLFRDTSAWYHIVCAVDTDESTADNRVRFYVNGVEETSFSTRNNPSSGQTFSVNNTNSQTVGLNNYSSTAGSMDGYMSHVAMVDGKQLAPTSFGETDSTSGIWKFKSPSGLPWGTNGFHLKFENSGNLGLDSSGNSNNFTVNGNLKQALDTPSNVYATLNPLDATSQTLSHGNLSGYGVTNKTSTATLGFDKGKWYWECKCVTQNTYTMIVGITNQTNMQNGSYSSGNVGTNANGWSYFMQNNTDNGKAFNNNTLSSVYQTISQGDILQIAVDADAGKIWWGVNGTYVNSGDPANGTNAVYTNVSTDQMLFPAYSVYAGSGGTPLVSFNFGNGFFGTTAIASAGSNGNGSLFEYDVPSGYYALNTKNLNTYG